MALCATIELDQVIDVISHTDHDPRCHSINDVMYVYMYACVFHLQVGNPIVHCIARDASYMIFLLHCDIKGKMSSLSES